VKGSKVPFFVAKIMTIKDKISEFLNNTLDHEKYFLVDIHVSSSKVRQKIVILIDSDTGIGLDECAVISNNVGQYLEENSIVPNAYTLELSSPGTDYPLSSLRQYNKNVGRSLKVIMKDGTEKLGQLIAATETDVTIMIPANKKKKIEAQPLSITLTEIAKAQVQVSFK
jgi:ribosome maturation factor RimP